MYTARIYSPDQQPAFEQLFAASDCGCYCRFWHFEAPKNDWLARLAFEPEKNAEESRTEFSQSTVLEGFVAYQGEIAVGWMKVRPRADLPKLHRQSVYKRRTDESKVGDFSVGCMLVHPAHRGKGVAKCLVETACAHLQTQGARALEAYPRHAEFRLYDEEAFMGPEALFLALGFTQVDGELPYPVLRKEFVRLPML